jgi:membrane associated rhomboid family serine protease
MSLPPPPLPPQSPPPPATPTLPSCYRHPGREAGRSCTRCGRAACGECLVQAAVGSHCVDCAKASRPATSFRAKSWNARQLTLVANVLIAVNVAVFALVTVADPKSLTGRGGISKLQYELGLNKLLLAQTDEWYRLVTSGFLHFGVLHIAFNMLLLYQLGQLLERSLGRLRFGLLYGASLLAGSFGVLLLTGNRLAITGGASGAVFGLMAAAAIGLHRQGVNIFSTGLGTTLVLNLVLTFAIPGISIGGHLGGAIGGAICGWFMLAPRWKPTPRKVALVVPIVVAVVSVIGSVIVVSLV